MPTPSAARPVWRVIAKTHVGASHDRKDTENQDDVRVWPSADARAETTDGPEVAVAVADGHGSASSFFSSRGSRFAVDVACALAAELVAARRSGIELPVLQRQLEEDGGKQLVREWRRLVDADLEEVRRPDAAGGPSEFDRRLDVLERLSGPAARGRVREDPHLAYGSTLLGAVVGADFMAFWQLGDGDIVVVDAEGAARRSIADDPRLVANETTSLCSPDAVRQVRVAFSGTVDPFVMIATDGLANSYADDEGFLKFSSDIFGIATATGLDAVHGRLYEWLGRISAKGSGDDMSVGILYRAPEPGAIREEVARP